MSLHLHGPGSGEEQHSRVRKALRAESRAHRHPTHSHSWHHPEPGLSPSSSEPSTAGQHQAPSSQVASIQCYSPPTLQHSHRQAEGLQIDGFLL